MFRPAGFAQAHATAAAAAAAAAVRECCSRHRRRRRTHQTRRLFPDQGGYDSDDLLALHRSVWRLRRHRAEYRIISKLKAYEPGKEPLQFRSGRQGRQEEVAQSADALWRGMSEPPIACRCGLSLPCVSPTGVPYIHTRVTVNTQTTRRKWPRGDSPIHLARHGRHAAPAVGDEDLGRSFLNVHRYSLQSLRRPRHCRAAQCQIRLCKPPKVATETLNILWAAPERVVRHTLRIWYVSRITAPPILLNIDLVPRADATSLA